MAFDSEKITDLIIRLTKAENQLARLVSDAESEKDTRRRTSLAYENELKQIRETIHEVKRELYEVIDDLVAWKNKRDGETGVIKFMVGFLFTLVVGLLLYVLTKR